MYNINEGRNQEIMEHCRTLHEYSLFVAKMRRQIRRTKGHLTEKELGSLLKEFVEEGILTDFLKTYGTEVISMLFTEMTEEEARDLAREDGYEYGYEEGYESGCEDGHRKEKEQIARYLKAKDMPLNDIAEVTGLTAQEIKEL